MERFKRIISQGKWRRDYISCEFLSFQKAIYIFEEKLKKLDELFLINCLKEQ